MSPKHTVPPLTLLRPPRTAGEEKSLTLRRVRADKSWLQPILTRGRRALEQANSDVSQEGTKEPVATKENGHDLHRRFRLHIDASLVERGELGRGRDMSRAHAPPLCQPPLQFQMLAMMEGMLRALGRRRGCFLFGRHRRRFCPFAFLGYFLATSRRRRHVGGSHEVAQGAASHRRRAHEGSTLAYNYAAALRICLLAILIGWFECYLSSDGRHQIGGCNPRSAARTARSAV